MRERGKPRRKYRSEVRRAQAVETRRRILAAARDLFLTRGFKGATVAAIAEEAGTSPETVYAVFENKRELLAALIRAAVVGEGRPESVLESPEARAIAAETDPVTKLALFSSDVVVRLERAAPLLEVLHEAARSEPQLQEIYRRLQSWRRDNLRTLAQALADQAALRAGMSSDTATEQLWLLASPQLYLLATRELGWEAEAYSSWLRETLRKLLIT